MSSSQAEPSPSDETGPRCPRCRTPIAWTGNPARPFCSATCKLIDLGGWLDERYRVPGDTVGREDREPDAPAGAPPAPR
jgi:uncharacterized protein